METQYNQMIMDIGWAAKADHPAYPVIKLRNLLDLSITDMHLEHGYQFSWQLSQQRFCPGFHDHTGTHPCPHQNILSEGYDHCAYCEHMIGFQKAFFYGEEPNEHMKKYLAQEHFIYFAFFQPDTIKVGTESKSRKNIRLIEQDALIAAYVAHSNGFEIQKLERAISTQLGYTEVIKSKQKFAYLSSKPSRTKADGLIHQAYHRAFKHFQNTEYASWFLPEGAIKITDNSENPHIYYPHPDRQIHKLFDTKTISGTYLGLRHKYLLLENAGSIVALNKRYLQGRKMFVSDVQETYEIKQKQKLTLFDV